MNVKIEIKSNRELFERASQEAIENAMEQCGFLAEAYAQTELTKKKAVDTGALRNSIAHQVADSDKSTVMYVGTNQEYAIYVEMGTGKFVEGGRQTPWAFMDAKGDWHMTRGMPPRPYIKPAIADHVGIYKKVIKEMLEGGIASTE